MASLGMPGYGYGIRYDFGMFHQAVDEHGEQVEMPDNWLRYGNSWEFERPEFSYPVKFYGRNVEFTDENGDLQIHWVDTEEVMAVAHDFPMPGYGGKTVTHIRLWKAKSPRDFDLKRFNRGNYIESVHHRSQAEALSRVLYPDDSTYEGKALRLRQEYFFTSASLQDIIRRYLSTHDSLLGMPDKIAIQLNDTHPAVAVAAVVAILLLVGGGLALFGGGGTGTIHLKTQPANADVKFDGEPVGSESSPYVMTNVEPEQTHTLEVSKDGYNTWSAQVEVQAATPRSAPVDSLVSRLIWPVW